MGLLSWLNRRGNEVREPTLVDPAFKRADRALEKGAEGERHPRISQPGTRLFRTR